MNKKFYHKVNLIPLTIENSEQGSFRSRLLDVPYLLYEVERLYNGTVIAINKPGGKRNFGRLARNDFMVFIYEPDEESLWLISHSEILDDLTHKNAKDPERTKILIKGLFDVCCGKEPDVVISDLCLTDTIGIPVETILKAYKWIWGQEDCNYPTKDGRWLSMHNIIEHFGYSREDFE